MKPHKHAELIKAWADGAEIEYKNIRGGWGDVSHPCWFNHSEYRIKPEPKPDVVMYAKVKLNHFNHPTIDITSINRWTEYPFPNTKFTFDGETGELKSAEVLK